jgi:hypothetical protein
VDFWWQSWPKHGYEPTDRQRDRMQETFAQAWEQGVQNPDLFFNMLQTLGYDIHTADWDEWRDWYNNI